MTEIYGGKRGKMRDCEGVKAFELNTASKQKRHVCSNEKLANTWIN